MKSDLKKLTTTYHNLNNEATFFRLDIDNMRKRDFIALEIKIFFLLRKKHLQTSTYKFCPYKHKSKVKNHS